MFGTHVFIDSIIDYHAIVKHGESPIIDDFCTDHIKSIASQVSLLFPDEIDFNGHTIVLTKVLVVPIYRDFTLA